MTTDGSLDDLSTALKDELNSNTEFISVGNDKQRHLIRTELVELIEITG